MQSRISYQQLQPEDRMTIASKHQQDCSVAWTISRELGHNTVGAQAYGPQFRLVVTDNPLRLQRWQCSSPRQRALSARAAVTWLTDAHI